MTNLFKENKEFDQARKLASQEVCDLLKQYFEEHPSIRFWQAIEIINSIVYENKDAFYEEPDMTVMRIKAFLEVSKNKNITNE